MSNLALATILLGAALAASMISVELGISVALIELGLGVVIGNAFDVTTPDWLVFLAGFAGIVLTFLAGAEVDVQQFRREWRSSAAIGSVSFAAPFLVATAFVLGTRLDAGGGGNLRHRAVDDEPRGRLRGPRRDRPQPNRDRQADHGRDVRHRPRDRYDALDPVRDTERVGHPLPTRTRCCQPSSSASCSPRTMRATAPSRSGYAWSPSRS